MRNRYPDDGGGPVGASFVGSFREGLDEVLIVLRGDIDLAAARRLERHITDAIAARARFVTVEATAVHSYHPDLLMVLGHTQQRLGARRGLLQVRGLRPELLPRGAAPVPAPEHLQPIPKTA